MPLAHLQVHQTAQFIVVSIHIDINVRRLGLSVGLLDADIYGPSAPKLFGLRAKPAVIGERTLVPLDGFGVKVMSIGFVVEEAKALVSA